MHLTTYLTQLTRDERDVLAVEIGCSLKYMQKLSTGHGSASIGLFCAILQSEFNSTLPRALRLYKKDEVKYRIFKAKGDH